MPRKFMPLLSPSCASLYASWRFFADGSMFRPKSGGLYCFSAIELLLQGKNTMDVCIKPGDARPYAHIHYILSIIVAIPYPPPMHMVASPERPPRRSNSCT